MTREFFDLSRSSTFLNQGVLLADVTFEVPCVPTWLIAVLFALTAPMQASSEKHIFLAF